MVFPEHPAQNLCFPHTQLCLDLLQLWAPRGPEMAAQTIQGHDQSSGSGSLCLPRAGLTSPEGQITSTPAHTLHLSQLNHIDELSLQSPIGTTQIRRFLLLEDEKPKVRQGPGVSGMYGLIAETEIYVCHSKKK